MKSQTDIQKQLISNMLDWTRRHTRNGNPVTSIKAAESVREVAAKQAATILAEMTFGDGPMAVEEIADRLDMTPHAVGKRMSDLERGGVIRKTNEMHRNRSGRRALKWRCC